LWPLIRDWLLSPVAKKDNYGRRADGGCRDLSQYTIKMTLPRLEGVWKSRDVNPRIINFKIRCRWMVSFTRRPLYLWGKTPYLLNRIFLRAIGRTARSVVSGV